MRGLFVVVDGPDGVGKSTLVDRLAENLRGMGRDVVQVREPGGTDAAEFARRGAFDPELDASPVAELFFILAARADLVAKVIRPALEEGRVVLSDRYQLSTEAYQIAGRDLPAEAVQAANALATGGLVPDLTLVLDLPFETALQRRNARGGSDDRIEGETRAFHERVFARFAAADGDEVEHIDAGGTPDEVAAAAWSVLSSRMETNREPAG